MIIAIDGQSLQTYSKDRGVGRYTKEILKSLIKINNNSQKYTIKLCLNGTFHENIADLFEEFAPLIGHNNIHIWQNYFETSSEIYFDKTKIELASIVREAFFWSIGASIIFSTNNQEGLKDNAIIGVKTIDFGAKYISVLYDLVPFYYPEYLGGNVKKWYDRALNTVLNSDEIITISNSSKTDIVNFLNVTSKNITIAYCSVDKKIFNNNTPKDELVLKKFNLDNKFIFYIGGDDKHKNLASLIEAYGSDQRINKDFLLVLAGSSITKNSFVLKQIKKYDYDIQKNIRLIGFVDDYELVNLYKYSTCFVFPSTHEGFGLPILEAMSCETPVLAANQSSMKEIINYSPALFDPKNIKEISEKIFQCLNNEDTKYQIVNNNKARVKLFDWDISAQTIYDLFINYNNNNIEKFDYKNMIEKIKYCIRDIDINSNDMLLFSESLAKSIIIHNKFFLDVSSIIMNNEHETGIQRVARSISKILLDTMPDKVYLVYSSADNPNKFLYAKEYMINRLGMDKELYAGLDEQVEFYNGDYLLYLDLHPSNAINNKNFNKNLMHRGIKVFHVIYDLIPVLHKNFFWDELNQEFELWLDSVSYSTGSLCISNSVAKDLEKYFKNKGLLKKDYKISYFHLGADIENSKGLPENYKQLISTIEKRTSFLMVGTIEPRKGHKQTLRAFEILWSKNIDITLVIVGKQGWMMEDFIKKLKSHPELNKRLFCLEGISDEYLEKVYDSSVCLIAASEAEGFGLPLIEAAQKKKPIIARDIPVFREVAKEFAYYFENDNNPEVLAETIKKWLELYNQNQHPKSDNMPWLTWKQSAEILFNKIIEN